MTTHGLRIPTQIRSQQTLERILESATALIMEQSYDDITIAEIAERAGTSVGGFYSRFSNKEALFNALQQRLTDETQSAITRAFEMDWDSRDLRDLLRLMVSNNAELYKKYLGVFKVNHLRSRIAGSTQIRNSISVYNAQLCRQLEKLILLKQDQIQHRQPRVAIRAAIACMTSMLRDAIVFEETLLYPKPADIQTIIRTVTHMMHRYLAATSE